MLLEGEKAVSAVFFLAKGRCLCAVSVCLSAALATRQSQGR